MRTFAITGGIGSGKSTVCSFLRDRGIPVYDSDSSAKRLYREDDSLLDSIEEAFGCSVRTPEGYPDFRRLASIVFSFPDKLSVLESLVHPVVLKDFKRWRALQATLFEESARDTSFFGGDPFCVIESAIILEKPEFLSVVDSVILVDAPLKDRLLRACERDGADPAEIVKRMSAQKFDLSKVNYIIRNVGTESDLQKETEKVFAEVNGGYSKKNF